MKDFSNIDTQTNRVFNALEQSTGTAGQQDTASPEEVQKRQAALKTQGRKGARSMRINMPFTPENYRFIKVFASSTGRTMTEACNVMLDYARTSPEFIEIALNQLESLRNDIENFKQECGSTEA